MARDLRLEVILAAVDRVTRPLRSITQGSSEMAQRLKQTREALKALQNQQKDVNSFRQLQEASKQTSDAMRASRERVKALQDQIANAARPTRQMTTELNRARKESQKLSETYGNQQRRLHELEARLGSAGIRTNRLGAEELRLRRRIDESTRSMAQQQEQMRRLAAQQARLTQAREAYSRSQQAAAGLAMGGVGAMAAGVAMGGPIVQAIKNYSSFEDAMLGVAKQVEGARDENGKLTATYYDMANAIQHMSETIPMASTEIAALIEGGARMGIKGKDDLLSFAQVAATAATAFELPADQIGENLARIAGLYKLPIKNIGELGDAINWLDDNAQSKGGDIIDVLQRTAGITASVGMNFKDAATLGSTFLSLGSSAEIAATATNAIIRELAIATQQPKRFAKGLKALGLQAEAIQKGMAKDATGTIQIVLEAINKLPQEQQVSITTMLFGKEYGDDAAKLANNLAEYRRQLDLVRGGQGNGSMAREGEIRNEALSARYQMSVNRLFNLSSQLGEKLRPALVELMSSINGIISRISAWAAENPELVTTLLKIASVLSVLVVAGGTLALVIGALIGPIAMARLAMTTFGISTGIALSPIMLIIAAVAALAAGAYLLWSNWDSIGPQFAAVWEQIKSGATSLMSWFAGLPARFMQFGADMLQGLINGIIGAMGGVKDAIVGAGEATVGWFKEKLGIHSPSRVFAELGGYTMQGLQQGLQQGEKGPLDALASTVNRMTTAGAAMLGITAGALPAVAGQMPTIAQPPMVQELIATRMPAISQPLAVDNRPPLSAAAGTGPQIIVQGDTNTISISAAGIHSNDLVQQINRILDERERSKAARIRSRLTDLE